MPAVKREASSEFVVECLWPDVHEDDLHALDQRAARETTRLAAQGRAVHYLGSMLMREDEVVLCRFAGDRVAVHEAADAARIPFQRILETASSPWSAGDLTERRADAIIEHGS